MHLEHVITINIIQIQIKYGTFTILQTKSLL